MVKPGGKDLESSYEGNQGGSLLKIFADIPVGMMMLAMDMMVSQGLGSGGAVPDTTNLEMFLNLMQQQGMMDNTVEEYLKHDR